MKNLIPYLLVTSFLTFSCSEDTNENETKPTTKIIIENGVIETNTTTNDSVYIWSNPPADGQVFEKWIGNTETLSNANEWKTKIKISSQAATVTATYKNYTSFDFIQEPINGSEVYYYVPLNYKGVILPFHGAGGSATGWIDKQLENRFFIDYAIAAGYAVVITESKDRVNKRWDNTPNSDTNIDIENIAIILSNLQNRSLISSAKPLFAVGMSQGGGFASLISALENYNAAALYCIPGISSVFEESNVPVIWNMAENDVTEEPTRLQDAEDNYLVLKSRGIACSFYVNPPSPLNPILFRFIDDVTETIATDIYESLKINNWLDTNHYFTVNPRQNEDWKNSIDPAFTYLIPDIEDQIFVCFTEHKFYKDSNYRTIRFFDSFD
jgi:hypothetical protein